MVSKLKTEKKTKTKSTKAKAESANANVKADQNAGEQCDECDDEWEKEFKDCMEQSRNLLERIAARDDVRGVTVIAVGLEGKRSIIMWVDKTSKKQMLAELARVQAQLERDILDEMNLSQVEEKISNLLMSLAAKKAEKNEK